MNKTRAQMVKELKLIPGYYYRPGNSPKSVIEATYQTAIDLKKIQHKTINKNNWSGEKISYTLIGNKIYLPNDYVMKLSHYHHAGMLEEQGLYIKAFWGFDGSKLDDVTKEQNELCTIHKYKGEYFTEEMGVAREGETPDVVAVEMFCNLV